jgi:hypothetical protein
MGHNILRRADKQRIVDIKGPSHKRQKTGGGGRGKP